ncbi:hypothetical protein [Nocardia concava]|uniref:hypothetical protein n=1 Tax=Nocardia concava TaxID=257281 RepID=UPI00030CE36A|nr:hypothetical protein [Nocardia concava]
MSYLQTPPGQPAGRAYSPYSQGPSPYLEEPIAGGATAIVAGVLATIAGVLSAGVGLIMVTAAVLIGAGHYRSARHPAHDHAEAGFVVGIGAAALLIGVLWCVGAVLLLLRKPSGRALLIGMSLLATVFSLIITATSPVPGGIGLAVAVGILIFATVPSTTRWLADARKPVADYVPYPML